MTRAEKRRMHRLMNPIVHSDVRALRLMVDGSLMTAPRARECLDVELQTARNCLCKLVTVGHAAVDTPRALGRPATYRITAAGRRYLAVREEQLEPFEDETEIEEAERRAAQQRAAHNINRARTEVPNSVFALGTGRRAISEGATA